MFLPTPPLPAGRDGCTRNAPGHDLVAWQLALPLDDLEPVTVELVGISGAGTVLLAVERTTEVWWTHDPVSVRTLAEAHGPVAHLHRGGQVIEFHDADGHSHVVSVVALANATICDARATGEQPHLPGGSIQFESLVTA